MERINLYIISLAIERIFVITIALAQLTSILSVSIHNITNILIKCAGAVASAKRIILWSVIIWQFISSPLLLGKCSERDLVVREPPPPPLSLARSRVLERGFHCSRRCWRNENEKARAPDFSTSLLPYIPFSRSFISFALPPPLPSALFHCLHSVSFSHLPIRRHGNFSRRRFSLRHEQSAIYLYRSCCRSKIETHS